MKRSQISIFIVLGIVMLIMIGFLLYLQSQEVEYLSDEIIERPSVFPVDSYITFCLEQETRAAVKELARAGGSIHASQNNGFSSSYGLIAYHMRVDSGNQLLTREQAQLELSEIIKEKLESCISITDYSNLEYTVTQGDKDVQVQINQDDIFVELQYPIQLSRDQEVIVEDYFSTFVSIPLGVMFDLSTELTNAELQGPVNLDYYRLQYPQLAIFVKNMYPDVVYSIENSVPKELSDYLVFPFAIEKADMTALKFVDPKALFETPPKLDQGACYVGSVCYSNTNELNCQQASGIFESGLSCVVSDTTEYFELYETALGDSCNGWFDLYTGEFISQVKTHGESWCSNDPGVGGRYYKLSCINGNVVPESCADYRDEICAQEEANGFTTAICRPNRFWSCQSCDSQDCCNNRDQRDCVWDTTAGCFPIAEPGIPFWNTEFSSQICSSGASRIDFDNGFNFQKNAASCFSAGDCGSKSNYIGAYTNQETVLTRPVITESFFKNLVASQRDAYAAYDGDFMSEQFILSSSFFPAPTFEFIEVLHTYLRNIDEILIYDTKSILDPDVLIPLESISVSQCEAWTPSQLNQCALCGSSSVFDGQSNYAECSEYRCKSLGSDCEYYQINGSGYCRSPFTDSLELEIVSLSAENYDYEFEETSLGSGIRLTEDVKLNRPLQLQLDTNKEALCKLSYLPDKDFSEISGDDLTGKTYSSSHEISLSFNHDFDIFDSILDYFQKDRFSLIIGELVDLRYKMESLKRQYPLVQKYSSGIYSLLVPIVDFYSDESTKSKLDMIFSNLDERNYFIFLKCQDLSGKETSDFYFRFNLNDPCQDDTAPEIVYSQATGNGDLTIFVNEVSSCSYDTFDVSFDQMQYALDCQRNPYAVSGIGNGSYECTADISEILISEDDPTIYVKCQDHPEFVSLDNSYELLLNDASNADILNENTGYSVSTFSTEDMIFVDATTILAEHSFGVFDIFIDSSFQSTLELLFKRPMQCTLEGNDLPCSSTRCIVPIDRDLSAGLTLSCKEKIPQCDVYATNTNEESYVIEYTSRTPLKIESSGYSNSTFIVTYTDLADAKTDCGIELQKRDGYFAMKQVPNTNQFVYKRTDDRVGAFIADVICLNKYGDKETTTIQYQ